MRKHESLLQSCTSILIAGSMMRRHAIADTADEARDVHACVSMCSKAIACRLSIYDLLRMHAK